MKLKIDCSEWPIKVFSSCQICGGDELVPLYAVDQDNFSYLMMRCRVCGHVQVGRTQLPPEQKVESSDYFRDVDAQDARAWEKMDAFWGGGRLRAFRNIIVNLKELGFAKGRMLEMGSAFGHMLNIAKKEDFVVLGVEPSPLARRLAKEKFGIESMVHIDEIGADTLPFDVILCLETLYYCHDVRDTLGKIRERVSPKGCFVLKIRSNRTNLFRFFSILHCFGGQLLRIRPGSLLFAYSLRGYHLFKTRNIKRLLESTGFRVIKTLNEKQALTLGLSVMYVLKMLRIAFSACVSAVTLGRVKIGTEITVYAAPK